MRTLSLALSIFFLVEGMGTSVPMRQRTVLLLMKNGGPSTYPRLTLLERRQELRDLRETRPDYESCRRSLEQAIKEITVLLQDIDPKDGPHPKSGEFSELWQCSMKPTLTIIL